MSILEMSADCYTAPRQRLSGYDSVLDLTDCLLLTLVDEFDFASCAPEVVSVLLQERPGPTHLFHPRYLGLLGFIHRTFGIKRFLCSPPFLEERFQLGDMHKGAFRPRVTFET